MNASLNKKLGNVKWGDYKMGELFQRVKTNKLPYKADELPNQPLGEYTLPCLTSSFNNQGLNYYAPREGATILQNVISIPSNSDVYRAYYQPNDFTVLSDAYAIRWIFDDRELSSRQYLFMVMCINKVTDLPVYSYKNKLGGWNVVKNKHIQLPQKRGEIDFDFMESFIAELEAERVAELSAYLTVSGLDNYELSNNEMAIIERYKKHQIPFSEFEFIKIFNNIKQGRRLKKDDQLPGDIPFVMSGTTNTGVIGYISNPVARFPKNSITIDIFGNSFYRNYDFGAGDDTGVYWNTEKEYSRTCMLFFAAAMGRALRGKYSYGKKLRSSQSIHFKMQLPTKDGKPDYDAMAALISAVQKLVIKDVVLYADRKIEKTKDVTKR
jgi:hypothetical protein